MKTEILHTCRDQNGICPSHIVDCCPQCMKEGGPGRHVRYLPETWKVVGSQIKATYLCGRGHAWPCWWAVDFGRRGLFGGLDDC